MTPAARNFPHPSTAVDVAVGALAGQGRYGVVTDLARQHGLPRRGVYELREQGRQALEQAFAAAGLEKAAKRFTLELTEEDIARTVIALRVVTPASIRDEVAMLPIIYGFGWSYGKIWGVLAKAEEQAETFLAGVNLAGILHIALDELFSQRRPVFGGIDLDTQYLFLLEAHKGRSGQDWSQALDRLRDQQNLRPAVVVKDAGSGLASGVQISWFGIDEYDDMFHATYMMGKEAYHLERRAYASITKEEKLMHRRSRAKTESQRRGLGQQLRRARPHTERAIERYDLFEALQRQANEVLQLADRGSGRLRTSTEVLTTLTRVSEEMMALGTRRIRKVARYIGNRAPGLGRYLDKLGDKLREVTEQAGGPEVVEAVVRAYQAGLMVEQGGPAWDKKARRQELEVAADNLFDATGGDAARLVRALRTVLPVLAQRHRASSAIENMNSVLRPYLVVQKSASQGFLNLFRFHWNTRTREWGPGKGTSPYQALTGQRVDDWLTLLGYPPSETMAAAAAA